MKILNVATLIASTSAALIVASPSFAAEQVSTAAGAASASAGVVQKRNADNSKVKYCMKREANTGSRLAPRQCLTKAEWEALGLEITTK